MDRRSYIFLGLALYFFSLGVGFAEQTHDVVEFIRGGATVLAVHLIFQKGA